MPRAVLLASEPETDRPQFFAAYDEVSIYAVGSTADEAVANAIRETQDPDATFQTAPISEALAVFIEHYGWDLSRSFAMIDGCLVDTTRAGVRA